MSYTKHNYKKGDELLASQLNEMDDQIALNEENLNITINKIVPTSAKYIAGAYIDTSVSVGNVVDLTPISNDRWSYAIMPCDAGATVEVGGSGGTKPKVLAFLDDDNKMIYHTNKSVSSSNIVKSTFTAPEGTAKLVCNSGTADNHYCNVIYNNYKHYYESNMIGYGNSDIGWISNWNNPEALSFKRVKDKLYWAFTSHSGSKGIAEYDFNNKHIIKRALSKIDTADLHNDLAIHIFDDGIILAAYSSGHNDHYDVRIRRSKSPECLEYFEDEQVLISNDVTTYAQLVESSSKLYLFYRICNLQWAYRYTTDRGVTWSDEVILIVSDAQYYCLFKKTTSDNVIRVISYTNPGASPQDTNIRQSFFHTDTNTLYNSNNSTALGTNNINKSSIDIIIPNDSTLTNQRLLDVAVSAVNAPMILYAPYSTYTNAIYRLYNAGVIKDIVSVGTPLINASYFLGAKFIGTDKIVVFNNIPYEEVSYTNNAYINTNVNIGNTVNMTPTTHAQYCYGIAPCAEGVKVVVQGIGGSNPKVLAFIDANNKLLFKTTEQAYEAKTYVAPANTTQVVVNAAMSSTHYCHILVNADYGGIYDINNNCTLVKQFYSENVGANSIRNFYPLVDNNYRAILWLRGIYGSTYTDFNTAAMIYLINEDEIIQ